MCRPVVVVIRRNAGSRPATKSSQVALRTETIANLTWAVAGTEAHAQVFQCDGGRSIGPRLEPVFRSLNPGDMNHGSSFAGWAYLSFLRLQHYTFIQPEGRHCGYRGRIFRSAHVPVKEVSSAFRVLITSVIG